MNFFAEQDQARRNTRLLVILFLLAVGSLILLTNVLVAITWWFLERNSSSVHSASIIANQGSAFFSYFHWRSFGWISLWVSATIGCVILFKWMTLSGGGRKIAETMGGVRINPNTDEPELRKVINVVEEMALASGMPVPPVYLMQHELGINAFAAGNTPADAVIGVTRGAVEQFNREQLQGVIAHEFSHILNGDMRLNMRIIALLSGIVFVGTVGEIFLRGSGYSRHRTSRSGSDNRVALLGLALLAIGWLGCFMGSLIKAAISRQREFLADASAVQFTRNPSGIADALKIIGGYSAGSVIENVRATEASHLFISRIDAKTHRFFNLSSHPPLPVRIKKIDPRWNGKMISRQIKTAPADTQAQSGQPTTDQKQKFFTAAAIAAGAVSAQTDGRADQNAIPGAQDEINVIPLRLRQQVQDSFGAIAAVYGLLICEHSEVQRKQLHYIQLSNVQGLSIQVMQLRPDLKQLGKAHRLPLLELAIPALKTLSQEQYRTFKRTLLLLIRADEQYELFEWCLYQLVRHYLASDYEKPKPSRPLYKHLQDVQTEFSTVLSTLAHHGHDSEADARRAFHRGANTSGLYTLEMLPNGAFQLDDFAKAVDKLANTYPLLKPRILKSLADCAQLDGELRPEEAEIIASIAAVMDAPAPIATINAPLSYN